MTTMIVTPRPVVAALLVERDYLTHAPQPAPLGAEVSQVVLGRKPRKEVRSILLRKEGNIDLISRIFLKKYGR